MVVAQVYFSECAVQRNEQGGELLAATRGEGGGGDTGNAGGKVATGRGTVGSSKPQKAVLKLRDLGI